jgi:hypothetical protein
LGLIIGDTVAMAWHKFVEDESYEVAKVVAAIRKHLDAGGVEDVAMKRVHLSVIEDAAGPLTFAPDGWDHGDVGWERSPMNARAWVSASGERLRGPD